MRTNKLTCTVLVIVQLHEKWPVCYGCTCKILENEYETTPHDKWNTNRTILFGNYINIHHESVSITFQISNWITGTNHPW